MAQQVSPQGQGAHYPASMELKPMTSHAYQLPPSGYYYPPPPQQQSWSQNESPTPEEMSKSAPARPTVRTYSHAFIQSYFNQSPAPNMVEQQTTHDASSTGKKDDQAADDGKMSGDSTEKKDDRTTDNSKKPGDSKDITGFYNGGSFRINHYDSNALLIVGLAKEAKLFAKPGAMVTKTPEVILRGSVSFSWMKLFARSELSKSEYTGTGKDNTVTLAPSLPGAVFPIPVNTNVGQQGYTGEWKVGRDAFLASTESVHYDYETQSLAKAMFSGEGLFVYKFYGKGVLFLQSFGAISCGVLKPGEILEVDNGHLVAWNCDYEIRRVASGGIISGLSAREGLACRFTGPGLVLFQSRKLSDLAAALKKAGR